MVQIIAPLKVADQKQDVFNLNTCLIFLLEAGVINTDRITHVINLKQLKESINQKVDLFSSATEEVIKLFSSSSNLRQMDG